MAENKKSKKKVLLYYLILAACLLVIAAVTVTVVLTVGRNKNTLSDGIQTEKPNDNKPNDNNPDDNKPDDGKNDPPDDNKPNDNKPTNTDDKFQLPVAQANVTCAYEFAYDKTLDRFAVHRGMDFEGKAGDNVYAAFGGTVTAVVTGHMLNENYVTIQHKDGLTSTYKYIDAKKGLKVGDTVNKGDVIGTIALAGGMEMNEGEHLHFEMSLNGKVVDPDTYLDIIEK